VASFLKVTEAEGPGRRAALWVQGCSIRCPGCCNPHLFPAVGGQERQVPALLEEIAGVRSRIEGVTFLGGEPFEQAAPLAALAREVQRLGLSVMTFTGYTLEELLGREEAAVRALLASTDLLVDGRYEAALPERARRWAGSTNQRFHFLTGRYAPGVERISPDVPERTVEARISPGGHVLLTGWPERLDLPRSPSRPSPSEPSPSSTRTPAGSTRRTSRAG
jgi:anaerobic ribonucleoside-triphosphate reductase activating protein